VVKTRSTFNSDLLVDPELQDHPKFIQESSIFSSKKENDDSNSNNGRNELIITYRRNPEAKKLF
jgi:hypothetical protein